MTTPQSTCYTVAVTVHSAQCTVLLVEAVPQTVKLLGHRHPMRKLRERDRRRKQLGTRAAGMCRQTSSPGESYSHKLTAGTVSAGGDVVDGCTRRGWVLCLLTAVDWSGWYLHFSLMHFCCNMQVRGYVGRFTCLVWSWKMQTDPYLLRASSHPLTEKPRHGSTRSSPFRCSQQCETLELRKGARESSLCVRAASRKRAANLYPDETSQYCRPAK